MNKKGLKRLLSIVLCLVMVLGLVPVQPVAAASEDSITIITCSDFQNPGGHEAGKTVVGNILNAMKNDGVNGADGFFCCGDYNYNYSGTAEGLDALRDAVSSMVTDDLVFVQGNHDEAVGTAGLNCSGNNDPQSGQYGVFVINQADYMWYNRDEATIKNTAQNLIDYLNAKLKEGYNKPIFVLSHLSLHYSMRTRNDGDGQFANYIFDALNEAGEKGLNIIFMYGHNHSNGWDDYLGGAAVYLAKGDKINIAQGSQTNYKEETLNFAYMNAGYTGYYNQENEGAENILSMCAITITGDKVRVKRYSQNGVYQLKSAGVYNNFKQEQDNVSYVPYTNIYTSPQEIVCTDVTDNQPIANLIEETIEEENAYKRITDVSQLVDGGKYVLVYNATEDISDMSFNGTYIMLPTSVAKSNSSGTRIGFDMEQITDFDNDSVDGNYTDKAWTLIKSESGWRLSDGDKYAKFTNTSDKKITATLEEEGDVFTIGGSVNKFTFRSGNYYLNYNARGVLSGYESNAATFCIYAVPIIRETPDSDVPIGLTPDKGTTLGDITLPTGFASLGDASTVLTTAQVDLVKEGKVYENGNYSYKVLSMKNLTVEVTALNKPELTTIKIYNTVTLGGKNFKITSVAPYAFRNNKKIKSVVIGKNVMTIGKNAFSGCKNLKKVTLGANVKTIGAKCFYNCGALDSIVVNCKSIKTIRSGAFKKTATKMKVKMPKKLAKKQCTALMKKFTKAGVTKTARQP